MKCCTVITASDSTGPAIRSFEHSRQFGEAGNPPKQMEMEMLTFTRVSKTEINVDRGHVPFGQIWTFPRTRGEYHPWHAKPLNGEHRTFNRSTIGLEAAKYYMLRCAGYQH